MGRPGGAEKDKTGPDQCQAEQREREQGRSAVDGIGKLPEGSGSAESGAQAAAPAAAAAPVVPKGAAKSEPIELPETPPAGKTELNPK